MPSHVKRLPRKLTLPLNDEPIIYSKQLASATLLIEFNKSSATEGHPQSFYACFSGNRCAIVRAFTNSLESMIAEFGHFLLLLALALAIIQSGAAWLPGKNNALFNLSLSVSRGQFFLLALSFLALTYCFIVNDFSVSYVAANSNSKLPLIYRICAVWGAHEGSMLLWVFILSIWTLLVGFFSRSLALETRAQILSILGLISVGFLLFILMTSNPFERLLPNVPLDGRDLNPILQDPGLVIHPPMLYMGYVGFAVAFAFAIVALIRGEFDRAWAGWMRPWTIIAWCFLTFGISLGSWWAYRELGWGGWWFWDPVENASFMPWLSGTALIHSLFMVEKRNAFKGWAVLLAIITFSLSLLGTFLVRSGVLISVHSFAVDPGRGLFMLLFLMIVVGFSLILFGWRAYKLKTEFTLSLVSREALLLGNNLLLIVMMATVLLGTLYPLIIDAIGAEKLSVGEPYFNLVFTPLAFILMTLMSIVALVPWYEKNLQVKMPIKALIMWLAAAILAYLLPKLIMGEINFLAWFSFSLAIWLIISTLSQCHLKMPRSKIAMILAHCGLAVTVIGITATTTYSVEKIVRMQAGDHLTIPPYDFKLLGFREINGPNYHGVEAGISVSQQNQIIALLKPQQRFYPVQQVNVSKTAISITPFRDLYVALGEPLADNSWSLRIYDKPMVRWIWWGALLMILGGIVTIVERRKRLSA